MKTVEEGFFDQIPHLQKLTIADTVKHIGVTDYLNKLPSQNNTLISGTFGTYAEEFAYKYRPRFLTSNIEIAREGDYTTHYGFDILSLVFNDDGTCYINHNELCQGLSGGGEVNVDIRCFFSKATDAQKKIAAKCWGKCREQILKCKPLANFIEKAHECYKKENHKKPIISF